VDDGDGDGGLAGPGEVLGGVVEGEGAVGAEGVCGAEEGVGDPVGVAVGGGVEGLEAGEGEGGRRWR